MNIFEIARCRRMNVKVLISNLRRILNYFKGRVEKLRILLYFWVSSTLSMGIFLMRKHPQIEGMRASNRKAHKLAASFRAYES